MLDVAKIYKQSLTKKFGVNVMYKPGVPINTVMGFAELLFLRVF